MAAIQIDLTDVTEKFAITVCPTCGEAENLDTAIIGNWDCPACGSEFWITLARVITINQPDWSKLSFDGRPEDAAREQSLTNE